MRRKRLTALAVLALLSGCGSVATGGTSSTDPATTSHAKAVKFAQCMRTNGVSAFPDPSASGAVTLDGIVNGSSLDPNSPAWQRAIGACKALEPAGFTGHKRSTPEQSAARQFAQCIRQNGVPDFPDPAPNQPLVDTNRIPSAATSSGMSILNAAMHKCGTFAAAAGVHP